MPAIQKPTLGRVVIFTAFRGQDGQSEVSDEYPGTVVKHHGEGVIDIVTQGSNSTYHVNNVPYDVKGDSGTWRYPERCDDMIDVP
jgi:hypothetical protein